MYTLAGPIVCRSQWNNNSSMVDTCLNTQVTESIETIDDFLQSVEKRAYKMAVVSLRDHHEALDVIQDCMIKLVTNYGERSVSELKPLFYRILQNKITDWHRHQKLKNLIFFWQTDNDGSDSDGWLDSASAEINSMTTPEDELRHEQTKQLVAKALACLSLQQQQCYLLRSWEGFSVADTAEILGCSQGSVKTHYFRAMAKIKEVLENNHD